MECNGMVDRFHIEKRDYLRMNIETPVTYTVLGKSGVAHIGISQDFSATGLYMIGDFALASGDEIEFELNPSNQKLTPFIAKATVLSCSPDKDNTNTFHIRSKLLP